MVILLVKGNGGWTKENRQVVDWEDSSAPLTSQNPQLHGYLTEKIFGDLFSLFENLKRKNKSMKDKIRSKDMAKSHALFIC
jgi:hypothetical protein